jgi:diketogulonate reductase-like aldo/keto reductase
MLCSISSKKSVTEDIEPTWRAMEKLYKSGKARSIGVSNWKISDREAMLKYAEIESMMNQSRNPSLPPEHRVCGILLLSRYFTGSILSSRTTGPD